MPTAAIPKTMSSPDTHPPTSATIDTGVLAFPASIAQQMFWYLELLQGTVTAFNVPLRFSLTGPLDLNLFDRALNAVIQRHESLRTHFEEDDGELLQIVSPQLKLNINFIDISHLPAERIREEADRLGSIEANRTFKLSVEPLMRAELLRLGHDNHFFHFTVHHALFDGMSMAIFGKELAEFYQAFFENRAPRLEPLAIQYGDYSVWQKEFLQSAKIHGQIDYWKHKLKGMTEVALPTDFPRPAVKSWKGEITSILLPKQLSEKLQSIAAQKGATLFHVHLAAFMLLLRRYSGNPDVAVGAPVFGRNSSDVEPLIGVFINTLILRADLSGNPTFSDYLAQIRAMSLEAFDNHDRPFERLVHELRPPRDPSRNPLFQINFNHHRSFTMTEHFGGVDFTTVPSRSGGSIFDLHIFFVERDEGWRASLDYCTDLFTRKTMDRMLGNVLALLKDIAAHPEKHIEEYEVLMPFEKERVLTCAPVPQTKVITAESVVVPDNSTVSRLTVIWQDLLGVSNIGPDDDFFDLGGHSLMTLRMFSRIHKELGKSLPLAALLENPTIAKLTRQIDPDITAPEAKTNAPPVAKPLPNSAENSKSHIITLNEGKGETPLFCIHGGDGGVIFYRDLAAMLPAEIPFHAIESLELANSGTIAQCSVEEVAGSYLVDILRVQPSGPIRLAGYSYGGVVAHEIACLLTYMGHNVEFLGMFDTHNPASAMRHYGLTERLSVFWRKNRHLPLTKRFGLLKARIVEGARTNRRVRSELKAASESGPATAYSDMRRIQVREENWRAMQAYKPKPFAGRITLFKTTHVSDKYELPDDYGWVKVAVSGLDIIPVEGEHLALFSSENVGNLAKVLKDSLNATDSVS